MVVSKSSWHYRLYFWLKSMWNDEDAFNHNPDLCSYISTIVLAGLGTGLLIATLGPVIWLWERLVQLVMFCFANWKRGLTSVTTLIVAGLALIVYLRASGYGTTMTHEMLVVGKFVGTGLAMLAGGLVCCFIVLELIPSGIQKAKTAPFTQLATTWTRDKWNGTFCRNLTFVE
jgi:hypothetical protein